MENLVGSCCLAMVVFYCLVWGLVVVAIVAKRVDQRMDTDNGN